MPHYHFIPPAPDPAAPPVPVVVPATAKVSHAGPKFIRGIFAQPITNMAMVKILGFDTLVSIPMNHPPIPWATEATLRKLYQIRPAVGVKSLDEDNPLWIAWENPDEPDRMTPDRPGPPITQAVIDDNYAKARAAGVPTFTNFDGSRFLGIPNHGPVFGAGASYASILAKTDWGCTDLHPAAWGVPGQQNPPITLFSPGYASDTLREYKGDSDNSRMLMYVETTRETAQFPGPTIDALRTYLRQVDRRKMRGYIAFTFDFTLQWGEPPGKPNAFCGLSQEHREEIAAFNDAHQ